MEQELIETIKQIIPCNQNITVTITEKGEVPITLPIIGFAIVRTDGYSDGYSDGHEDTVRPIILNNDGSTEVFNYFEPWSKTAEYDFQRSDKQ